MGEVEGCCAVSFLTDPASLNPSLKYLQPTQYSATLRLKHPQHVNKVTYIIYHSLFANPVTFLFTYPTSKEYYECRNDNLFTRFNR